MTSGEAKFYHQEADGKLRTVKLPIESMDCCGACSTIKGEQLKLCSGCGERLYCSSECQSVDWRVHKRSCGKTDRIDLGVYYPLLALIAEKCRMNVQTHPPDGVHFAINHQILNHPSPDPPFTTFPGGYKARPVILGDEIPLSVDMIKKWWPGAPSPKVASKLQRRILRGGNPLPINIAVCVALLSEIYTTDSSKDSKPRIRLAYKSSPIADFGIVVGDTIVQPQDRLAYYDSATGNITVDQDPHEHSWIYFTTIRGEDIFLDCGMFHFNACTCVSTKGCCPREESEMFPVVPALFYGRDMRNGVPGTPWKERGRFSVLRNENLQTAIQHTPYTLTFDDRINIWDFLETCQGDKESTIKQRKLVDLYTIAAMDAVRTSLESSEWKKFPNEVMQGIETDPAEPDYTNFTEQDWEEHLMRWQKQISQAKKEARKRRKA
ncbi:hypothetical protein BDM02DRAFT_3120312 [Thelephora ganbajun]|uniref:Uncharacterized protein n=1 Tax=Thelephora ganbajun TaxID=370292 RepID=A0ACB6Z7Q9_THEGA|nr:hypothetical protein BDM02DRAFT_3120312 [Thelephora ganbajun]